MMAQRNGFYWAPGMIAQRNGFNEAPVMNGQLKWFYGAPVMIAHWNDFYGTPVMIAHWSDFYGAPGMIGRWSDFYEPLANGFVEAALLSWSWLSLLVFSLRWEWLLAGRGSGSSWETSHEKSEMRASRLSLACLQKPSTIYKTTI